jgi:hypothetical protein
VTRRYQPGDPGGSAGGTSSSGAVSPRPCPYVSAQSVSRGPFVTPCSDHRDHPLGGVPGRRISLASSSSLSSLPPKRAPSLIPELPVGYTPMNTGPLTSAPRRQRLATSAMPSGDVRLRVARDELLRQRVRPAVLILTNFFTTTSGL